MSFPSRIICLTEETVETLYLLGRSDLIAGVSKYVERPPEAKLNHPIVSQFIRSDIEQIIALRPDLVIGFSDIQKDVARELIGRGLNVFVTNQRSLEEILNQMLLLGRLIGEESKALKLIEGFREKIENQRTKNLGRPKVKVYFEEWDHPRLSGIRWVSELIDICGGENIFKHKTGSLASEREVSDEEVVKQRPELIIGCWCGKKVKIESFSKRPGYREVPAVKKNQIIEVDPAIFLQPGPALFIDGLAQMSEIIKKASETLDG